MSDEAERLDRSDTVHAIARLARLDLGPEEAQALADDLDAILRSFAVLDEFEPSRAAGEDAVSAPLREDRVDPAPLAFEPAELAPDWRDGFFVVPRLRALAGDEGDDG